MFLKTAACSRFRFIYLLLQIVKMRAIIVLLYILKYYDMDKVIKSALDDAAKAAQ